MVRVKAWQHGRVIFGVRALDVTPQLGTDERRPAIKYTLPDGSTGRFVYGRDVALDIFQESDG